MSIIIQFKPKLPGAKALLIFSASGFRNKQKSVCDKKKRKMFFNICEVNDGIRAMTAAHLLQGSLPGILLD